MYAILKHGGHQYRVSSGDHVVVDRLTADIGDVVGLEPVLLLSDGDSVQLAGGDLEGVRVAATVVAHRRGRKLRVFTFKPKKRHRRMLGFRAELTELVVEQMVPRGEPLPERVQVEEPAAEEASVGEAGTEAVTARPRRRRAGVQAAETAQLEAPAAAAPAASEPTETEPAPARGRGRRAAASTAAPKVESGTGSEGEPAVTSRRPGRRAQPAQAQAAGVKEVAEGTAPEDAKVRRTPRRGSGHTPHPSASGDAEAAADAPATEQGTRRRRVQRRDQPAGDEAE